MKLRLLQLHPSLMLINGISVLWPSVAIPSSTYHKSSTTELLQHNLSKFRAARAIVCPCSFAQITSGPGRTKLLEQHAWRKAACVNALDMF